MKDRFRRYADDKGRNPEASRSARSESANSDSPKSEEDQLEHAGLSRRAFIKGSGMAGVAVSAGLLASEEFLKTDVQGGAPGDLVGPGPVSIILRVNGKEHTLALEPRVTLLDALRNHLDITGAKRVCDRGTCGACTVLADNKLIYSCTLLAIDAQRRDIQTIEGLAPADSLHPISAAFVEQDAQQCGFCTPGFVMATKAYAGLREMRTPRSVRRALGGNLCRCGTYRGLREVAFSTGKPEEGARHG